MWWLASIARGGSIFDVVMHLHSWESRAQAVLAGADGLPICSTTEAAETPVRYRGEPEVRRVPLVLRPGEITLVTP